MIVELHSPGTFRLPIDHTWTKGRLSGWVGGGPGGGPGGPGIGDAAGPAAAAGPATAGAGPAAAAGTAAAAGPAAAELAAPWRQDPMGWASRIPGSLSPAFTAPAAPALTPPPTALLGWVEGPLRIPLVPGACPAACCEAWRIVPARVGGLTMAQPMVLVASAGLQCQATRFLQPADWASHSQLAA